MFKRLITAVLGINLMSLGLNIVLDINWGVGPFDSMTLLVQELFKLEEFANASLALHMFFAVILVICIKVLKIKIADIIISCLSIFVITRVVGLYGNFIDIQSNNIVLFVVAFLTLNLGLYLISISNLIIAPYDKFVVEFASLKNIELGRIRLICDGLLLAVVILLNVANIANVVISFGTVFITIGTGFNISLYTKLLGGKER